MILFTVSGLIALIGWLFFGLEMGSPIAVILLTPVLGMLLLKKDLQAQMFQHLQTAVTK